VPHRGTMCLLDRMVDWNAERIECVAGGHRDPAHPLRSRSGLMASAAIEYAAQAAALHGGLLARAAGAAPSPGYLASAREVRLVEHDAPAARREDLGDPVTHQPRAADEDVLDRHRVRA